MREAMHAYPPPASWSLRAACLSDIGRVRQSNEDRCLVNLKRNLFIVSDGMGGQQAGGTASEVVVTVLPPLLDSRMSRTRTLSNKVIENVLQDVMLELSQRLRTESTKHMGLQGMGATVALAWVRGETAHLAHMGDSRIYLLHQDKLSLQTEDHSIVALLLRHGEIAPEEMHNHPARGRLTRYIGMKEDVFPDVQTLSIQSGDRLLLCSDGLTGMVSGRQIEDLLRTNPEPNSACQALVEAANAAGGKDNITALVVNCGE
jgi:PPM family protein phosphatase